MGSKVFAGVGHKLISCIHSWLHNESIYHSIPVSMYIHWMGLAVNEWLILLSGNTPSWYFWKTPLCTSQCPPTCEQTRNIHSTPQNTQHTMQVVHVITTWYM